MAGIIGISTAEQGRYSLFYAFLSGLYRPENTTTVFASGAVISENRNKITQAALDRGADWVLYLDDDHVLQADTLYKLLDAEKDIISAHYVKRKPPFNPVLMQGKVNSGGFLWKQLGAAERGIIEVDAAGAGCLLVRRRVLEALKPPYWTLGQINPASWGDDLDFCNRVKAAGFPIYCDLDNRIGHIMSGIVTPEYDAKNGWVAGFTVDPSQAPLSRWLMPLPGDDC